MRNTQSRLRVGALGVAVAAFAVLTGCAPGVAVRVQQPFAPPTQRDLRLAGDDAWFTAADGLQRVALSFALPGAYRGPRMYVLYFQAPDRDGTWFVGPGDEALRGFLIQTHGDLAGRVDFASGSITLDAPWYARGARKAVLALNCADGTRIDGQARLRPNAAAVRAVEREFVGDVRQLMATTQPADAPGAPPITPRRASVPQDAEAPATPTEAP